MKKLINLVLPGVLEVFASFLLLHNALINEEEYRKFVESGNLTEEKIRKFSKEQNVKPFIVVGRIHREQKDYKLFYNLKTRYKWE